MDILQDLPIILLVTSIRYAGETSWLRGGDIFLRADYELEGFTLRVRLPTKSAMRWDCPSI